MKATSILFVLLAMAMAMAAIGVAQAQPVDPVAGLRTSALTMEPAWMLLSGAALLLIASAVRRYVP